MAQVQSRYGDIRAQVLREKEEHAANALSELQALVKGHMEKADAAAAARPQKRFTRTALSEDCPREFPSAGPPAPWRSRLAFLRTTTEATQTVHASSSSRKQTSQLGPSWSHILPPTREMLHYHMWSYELSNLRATHLGRRLFYQDETGETVPASDGEDEPQLWRLQDGPVEDECLRRIAAELGTSRAVLRALAGVPWLEDVSEKEIGARMQLLGVGRSLPLAERNAQGLDAAMRQCRASLCQRCFVYRCPLHTTATPRPTPQSPLAPPPPAAPNPNDTLPCTPDCYRHTPLPRPAPRLPPNSMDVDATPHPSPSHPDAMDLDSCVTSPVKLAAACQEEEQQQASQPAATAAAGSSHGSGRGGRRRGQGRGRSGGRSRGGGSAANSSCGPGPSRPQPQGGAAAVAEGSGVAGAPSGAAADTDSSSLEWFGEEGLVGGRHERSGAAGASSGDDDERMEEVEESGGQHGRRGATSGIGRRSGGGRSTDPLLDELFACWDQFERDVFMVGLQHAGRDSCSIAELLPSRTCSQVHKILEAAPHLGSASSPTPAAGPSTLPGATFKPPRAPPPAYAIVQRRTEIQKEAGYLTAYVPCHCRPSCDAATCPCVQAGHFCEKFCGCYSRERPCPFVGGCNCKGGCRTKSCTCRAADRECDPELCVSCGPTAVGMAAPGCECCNMDIRLHRRKKVAVAPSSIPKAGWGAFILEQARKGDIIGEYTGEIISDGEAERRGKVYDRNSLSYLFNLNSSLVLDAMNHGNKMRFANHSKPGNVEPQVRMVDGDHRCALFAKENLAAGDELLYNYGYTEEMVKKIVNWADGKEPSSSRGSRGGGAMRKNSARPPRPL